MAGSTAPTVDCSNLDAFRVFGDYADTLRNRTSFNETLLRQCQKPICQALWGFGVPDISGIGVAIGYVLSIVISTCLCLLIARRLPAGQRVLTSLRKGQKSHPSESVLVSGLSSYFESAVYFSLAIQIATITILAPKDLETAASSIGYYETRIAGLVSTLSLLPLSTPVVILALYDGDQDQAHNPESHSRPERETSLNRKHTKAREAKLKTKKKTGNRHTYRVTIFIITVAASVYTFLSQSIRYWSPSTLGDHRGDAGATYITDQEWAVLWDVCFGELEGTFLSAEEHVTLGAFHMLASIVVLLFTVALVTSVLLRRDSEAGADNTAGEDDVGTEGKRLARVIKRQLKELTKKTVQMVVDLMKNKRWARLSLAVVAFCLTVPLLWGFFRLRDIQTRLALAVGGSYEGNEWGFGQVMAIAVFAPVGSEMLFVLIRRRYVEKGEALGQQQQDNKKESKEQKSSNVGPMAVESTLEVQGRERIKTWPWVK